MTDPLVVSDTVPVLARLMYCRAKSAAPSPVPPLAVMLPSLTAVI